MQAEGAFVGSLPEMALRRHADRSWNKSRRNKELSKVILEAEIKPYDQKYVHIEVLTFSERVATKQPIRRDYALMQMQGMGTYIEEMEWTRIVRE